VSFIRWCSTTPWASNLSESYERATRELRQAIHNFEREANRQARAVTPVDLAASEIYDSPRKRLFKSLPSPANIDGVASAVFAPPTSGSSGPSP
jgi:hypothetical protein